MDCRHAVSFKLINTVDSGYCVKFGRRSGGVGKVVGIDNLFDSCYDKNHQKDEYKSKIEELIYYTEECKLDLIILQMPLKSSLKIIDLTNISMEEGFSLDYTGSGQNDVLETVYVTQIVYDKIRRGEIKIIKTGFPKKGEWNFYNCNFTEQTIKVK